MQTLVVINRKEYSYPLNRYGLEDPHEDEEVYRPHLHSHLGGRSQHPTQQTQKKEEVTQLDEEED
jgi:hypothetical protein